MLFIEVVGYLPAPGSPSRALRVRAATGHLPFPAEHGAHRQFPDSSALLCSIE